MLGLGIGVAPPVPVPLPLPPVPLPLPPVDGGGPGSVALPPVPGGVTVGIGSAAGLPPLAVLPPVEALPPLEAKLPPVFTSMSGPLSGFESLPHATAAASRREGRAVLLTVSSSLSVVAFQHEPRERAERHFGLRIFEQRVERVPGSFDLVPS